MKSTKYLARLGLRHCLPGVLPYPDCAEVRDGRSVCKKQRCVYVSGLDRIGSLFLLPGLESEKRWIRLQTPIQRDIPAAASDDDDSRILRENAYERDAFYFYFSEK